MPNGLSNFSTFYPLTDELALKFDFTLYIWHHQQNGMPVCCI